ncbi:MAG: haloacid dehalogenase-like hydrolase [Alteromonadaceae bacterium]|nr:haloacid dehalogenase-like hydrolase [Alteromonadaceae bacterium]
MQTQPKDALNSWQDGEVKAAILSFIDDVTDPNSEYFVEETNRIAVFDNDGTLWVEKPLMTQIEFIKDMLCPDDDEVELHSTEKMSFLDKVKDRFEDTVVDFINDIKNAAEELLDGVTMAEYKQSVRDWIGKTRHPRFDVLYTELTYTPMQEVLSLFRDNGFDCFIVSGGSTDFVRPWCEPTYRIPKQNIIGSSLRTKLSEKDGELHLEYLPVPFYFDNGDAKVKSIGRLIGKQPIAAFGNSHGDVEMLRWTGQAKRSISCLVHHTDAEREYKYSPDPAFHLGKSTLKMADQFGWHVIDMKRDWRKVFNFDKHE